MTWGSVGWRDQSSHDGIPSIVFADCFFALALLLLFNEGRSLESPLLQMIGSVRYMSYVVTD